MAPAKKWYPVLCTFFKKMWVLRQAGLPIFRSATTPWLTYKLCFCKKGILFETSLKKNNLHPSILDNRSHFCNWFSNLSMRIDLKLQISGDWSKFVDWFKSWKQDMFDQLPVVQQAKLVQLRYSQLYYLIE